MRGPRSEYVAVADGEIHVTVWGERSSPALVMWHGLARTGRDFDEIAHALADRYFVLCPDTLGRGLSSWAKDDATGYSYANYGRHAAAVLDHFGVQSTDWLGTSMGGLVGVTLAGGSFQKRIARLIVNDIGPEIPPEAAQRIGDYVGNPPRFSTMMQLEAWLRTNYAPFGKNTDEFWRRMADTSSRRTDDGYLTVHYDPRIVSQFTVHRKDLDCWPSWDRITAPILLIRGAESDVLPDRVAREMITRHPRARLEVVSGCGHAPTLADNTHIEMVRSFLQE